jgi:hypothetical protein
VLGGVAHRALYFFVTLVADQQDVIVLTGEPNSFTVHLGDQRAGGINGVEATIRGFLDNHRGDAVGGENNVGAFGDLGYFVHKNNSASFQLAHHMDVVNDLLAHIDRCPKALERLFYGNDRAIDSGAVTAGGCQQNSFGSCDRVIDKLLSARRDKRRLESAHSTVTDAHGL